MISWRPFLNSDPTSSMFAVADASSMMVSLLDVSNVGFSPHAYVESPSRLLNTYGTHVGIYKDSMMVTDAWHGRTSVYKVRSVGKEDIKNVGTSGVEVYHLGKTETWFHLKDCLVD